MDPKPSNLTLTCLGWLPSPQHDMRKSLIGPCSNRNGAGLGESSRGHSDVDTGVMRILEEGQHPGSGGTQVGPAHQLSGSAGF